MHFASGANPEGSIFGSIDTLLNYASWHFLDWIDAQRFIYFPASSYNNKEDIQIFVGEISGETILSYKSNVFMKVVFP